MTDFETELVRAIEHGCPGCAWDEFGVRCRVTAWARAGDTLRWGEKPRYLESTDHIRCNRCYKTLWTAENGWIPELQEDSEGRVDYDRP